MEKSGALEGGFTVLELIVVLAILTVLATLATLQFNRYLAKGGVETELRTLHADLLTVRARALFEKRSIAVALTPGGFALYSSEVTGVGPVQQKSLTHPLSLKSTPYLIVFNGSGLSDSADGDTVCIDPSDNEGAVDSLVLYAARIETGKRNANTTCSAANIRIR